LDGERGLSFAAWQAVAVAFPLQPPLRPMLAKLTAELPTGDGWLYEPKWDGFRCIVFKDGTEIVLGSRNERPLTRYFPELLGPLVAQLPERCVVDGEIVVPSGDDRGLDFDALLQRIHPAASRVARLAAETPAAMVLFDVLAVGDRVVTEEPLTERRRVLQGLLTDPVHPLYLTPASEDPSVAEAWFHRFEGGGLDGVVAKRLDGPYTPDKRTMVKVKHERTADCAVAGYRIHKDGKGVGSLLLGLYDGDGTLHHVGVAAGFTVKQRGELLGELAALTDNALEGHPWRGWAEAAAQEAGRMPGAHSRWNAGKDLSWVPLRVDRVAEVTFGQLQSGRFRHGVRLVRWRPDRSPDSCTYGQLDVADPVRFDDLFRPV
jgi:ATP-dependent DNA ligase